jgi:hypothetical protein
MLVDLVAKKHFPFFYSTERKTQLICLSHKKMVLQAPRFNEATHRLPNFAQYDVGEQKEMQEFIERFCAYKQKEGEADKQADKNGANNSAAITNNNGGKDVGNNNKRTFTEGYHNLWKRYRDIEVCFESDSLFSKRLLINFLQNFIILILIMFALFQDDYEPSTSTTNKSSSNKHGRRREASSREKSSEDDDEGADEPKVGKD